MMNEVLGGIVFTLLFILFWFLVGLLGLVFGLISGDQLIILARWGGISGAVLWAVRTFFSWFQGESH